MSLAEPEKLAPKLALRQNRACSRLHEVGHMAVTMTAFISIAPTIMLL